MEFRFQRRLVLAATPEWLGWFCERCCWNRPLAQATDGMKAQASVIAAEFEAHSCEEFAAQHWARPPAPSSEQEPGPGH